MLGRHEAILLVRYLLQLRALSAGSRTPLPAATATSCSGWLLCLIVTAVRQTSAQRQGEKAHVPCWHWGWSLSGGKAAARPCPTLGSHLGGQQLTVLTLAQHGRRGC